jgi:diacylglycerol kinase family enzyme
MIEVQPLHMFRIVPGDEGTHAASKRSPWFCKKISISADRPQYIHADGEIYTSFGSNLRTLTVEVLPGALQIVRG